MNIFLFGVITILCGHFCVSALCNVQPGLWQRVTKLPLQNFNKVSGGEKH